MNHQHKENQINILKHLDEFTVNKTHKVNKTLDFEGLDKGCQNLLTECIMQLSAGSMSDYQYDHPSIKLNRNTAVSVCTDAGYRLDEPFAHKGKC